MLSSLASHNDDIKKLIDKGYAVSIVDGYLVVRDIPYLNQNLDLQQGAIISKLVFVDQYRVRQQDHQVFFCGSHPYQQNGTLIKNLGGGGVKLSLSANDLTVERSFSNKPPKGFKDLFEKIESYVTIISGPAMSKFDITPYTFNQYEQNQESVFRFSDTLTSIAGIGDLSSKLKNDSIAIIGLGGTGSYILDLLAKTPVKEIRAFDLDSFYVHNAFRSPGYLDEKELGKKKADVYQKRYEGFRKHINILAKYITSDSNEELKDISFAFVCVDKGSSRSEIIELLMEMKIPFIDVGMGLDRVTGSLGGTVRVTYFPNDKGKELLDQNLVPLCDQPDDLYRNNIQIAELNALNACLAVIKYKQIRGFYTDDDIANHILYTLESSRIDSI